MVTARSARRATPWEAVPASVVAAGASAWLALLVAAPYLATHAAGTDIRFMTADVVYRAAHLLCHQRAARSFHAWGLQLPVCARCFGLYASAAAAVLAVVVAQRRRRPAGPTSYVRSSAAGLRREGNLLLLAALPTAVSVGLEVLGAWAQTPVVRFVAALPLGFVVGRFVTMHAAEVATVLGLQPPKPSARSRP